MERRKYREVKTHRLKRPRYIVSLPEIMIIGGPIDIFSMIYINIHINVFTRMTNYPKNVRYPIQNKQKYLDCMHATYFIFDYLIQRFGNEI